MLECYVIFQINRKGCWYMCLENVKFIRLENTGCIVHVNAVGLDRYQCLVSVSGRYQWYRFGIGIADTAADTRTDTGWP